ncbi:MAG: hypothetical protein JW982_10695 [Spirochaetes bacterium]|nr:hypothetical protein [Spirochaetota bacterium]
MDPIIKNNFHNILSYSLNSAQINFLGECLDKNFNLYKESGYGTTIPIPQQTSANIITDYFDSEEEVVQLFTILLRYEGDRFYNRILTINGREKFIKLLEKRKWVFDPDLIHFMRDPFYEHEINFLKKIRVIDLRKQLDIPGLIEEISKISTTLGKKDLEWRINLRLYDLERDSSSLIRKIIEMLLTKQNLQRVSFEMFTCLKELVINASKANYKLLFEKYITIPQGINTKNNYVHFLNMFKDEIEEHGNERLFELAKAKDKYINITFQSTNTGIEMWVINNQNISSLEKQAILKRLGHSSNFNPSDFIGDETTEGAGLGLMLILSILKKYTDDKAPLKVIFYPSFIKIGFSLSRENLFNILNPEEPASDEEKPENLAD